VVKIIFNDSEKTGIGGSICQEQKRRVMQLIHVVIVLVVFSVLLWWITTFLPMDSKTMKILNIVVVIVVILWLFRAFGIMGSLS
jgi:apolipoprotein N-acyltransferase